MYINSSHWQHFLKTCQICTLNEPYHLAPSSCPLQRQFLYSLLPLLHLPALLLFHMQVMILMMRYGILSPTSLLNQFVLLLVRHHWEHLSSALRASPLNWKILIYSLHLPLIVELCKSFWWWPLSHYWPFEQTEFQMAILAEPQSLEHGRMVPSAERWVI